METETLYTQLLGFAESKESELYKKAKIVLESIKETLEVRDDRVIVGYLVSDRVWLFSF